MHTRRDDAALHVVRVYPNNAPRVEFREMLPNNFLATIALDAFSAAVPVCDHAFWTKHVNRAIGHTLHQQSKLFLTGAQGLGGQLALRQIPRDLGITNEIFVGVANGINDDIGPEPAAVLADPPAFLLEFAFGRAMVSARDGRSVLRSSSV
jgi:hypothetical protein